MFTNTSQLTTLLEGHGGKWRAETEGSIPNRSPGVGDDNVSIPIWSNRTARESSRRETGKHANGHNELGEHDETRVILWIGGNAIYSYIQYDSAKNEKESMYVCALRVESWEKREKRKVRCE